MMPGRPLRFRFGTGMMCPIHVAGVWSILVSGRFFVPAALDRFSWRLPVQLDVLSVLKGEPFEGVVCVYREYVPKPNG
jgi:hypothetical protein